MSLFSRIISKLLTIGAQKWFLFFALTWGLFTVFLTPPLQVPDEPNHFFRAYQISKGGCFPTSSHNRIGGYIPQSISHLDSIFKSFRWDKTVWLKASDLQNALAISINKADTVFLSFPNTARLIPIPYLPQAAGIFIGNIFNAPPLVLLYLGRIVNLLVWILLIYFAIKIIPIHKWLFLILALLPMSLFEAASLSADAFTNAISFFGVALFIRYALDDRVKIAYSDIAAMALVAFLISLSKSAYFLLAFLFFLIPRQRLAARLSYPVTAIIVVSSGMLGLIISGFFVNMVYDLYEPGTPFFYEIMASPDSADISRQFNFILAHPFIFAQILGQSLWDQFMDLSYSLIGVLGWLDTWLPMPFYYLSFLTLVLIAFLEPSGNFYIKPKQKLILLAIALTTVLGLATLMYLTWTFVGHKTIEGMQGRYLTPITPLLFFVLSNQRFAAPKSLIKAGAIGYLCIAFFVSSNTLHQRYWDFF